jgi:hypothetical protein
MATGHWPVHCLVASPEERRSVSADGYTSRSDNEIGKVLELIAGLKVFARLLLYFPSQATAQVKNI